MSKFRAVSRGTASGGFALALVMGVTNVHAAENQTIAEIIVTAQKRAENVQDVPASVSVFDDQRITELHASQLSDYAAYIPGLNVSGLGTPGQTTITLRGIAAIGDGAVVGTYVDDTPLGASSFYARASAFGLDLMPYDIERVEVLRGPQGTLYGASTMGGLLKYVFKDPSASEFELRAGAEASQISGADDLGWGARVGLNAPLGDKLAFRASFYDQETAGYIDNVANGDQDENDYSQYGGRASLLWQLSDALSIKLGGMWQRVETDNNASMAFELTGVNPPTGTPSFGDLKTNHVLPEPFTKDVDYYSLTVNWDAGWGSFVSASSYSTTKSVQSQDATPIFGVLYPLLTGGAIPAGQTPFDVTLELDKWTQEFRLASNPEGGRVEWLLGAFYTEEDSTNVQELFATDNNGQPIAAFSPYFAFASLPTNYQEIAGFGNLTFKLTDAFDITAGVRWARNEQEFRQISGGAILPAADVPGSSEEDVWTWAVSPRFHVNDDTMLYARVATGYRPGGPNAFLPGVPPLVDADKLKNYEAGVKTEFMDRRALVNLAVFYIDWTDIQQLQSFGGVGALTNAGDATSEGVELEARWALTDNFQLGLSAAYTDATLDEVPPEENPNNNVFGVQLPHVPEWSGALTADYGFTLAGHPARIGAGWRYVDERQSAIVQSPENDSTVLPSYDAIDLNADVTFNRMTLRLFARNVTDERAFTGGDLTQDGLDRPVQLDLAVLQPRTVGVSVDFAF